MSALALDAAPAVEELEIQVPGGGGPGDIDFGRGGGGEGDDDASRRDATLRLGIFLGSVSIFSFFTALAVIFDTSKRTSAEIIKQAVTTAVSKLRDAGAKSQPH